MKMKFSKHSLELVYIKTICIEQKYFMEHVREQGMLSNISLEGRKDTYIVSLTFLNLITQYIAHIYETGFDRVGTIQVLLPYGAMIL